MTRALDKRIGMRTGFADPFDVSIQFSFQLFLSTKFQKSLSIFNTLSFFGEFSAFTNQIEYNAYDEVYFNKVKKWI